MNKLYKIDYLNKLIVQKKETDHVPLSVNPLSRLPLGRICCKEGWLANQLICVSEGITGRLPEYGPFFKKENNGYLYPESNAGWEEVPYWFRGFYPLAVLTGNEKHMETAGKYLEAILASGEKDGWFGLQKLKAVDYTPEGEPIPDIWPNAILMNVLCWCYEYTGDQRILSLMKNFIGYCLGLSDNAFLPCRTDWHRFQKIRGGDMMSSLYWYYRQTGDGNALILAKRCHDKIWKSSAEFIANHAVDFGQRFAYDAIYSQQSGSYEHFAKSDYEYDKMAKVWGQMPRGIFAMDEQIRAGCTDPRQGYEPCGIVELAKSFYELEQISGETRFADRVEDIMLNHFPAVFTPDYKQIQYLTAANLPQAGNYFQSPVRNAAITKDRSFFLYTPNNRCCGHNAGMGWPMYVMNLWKQTWDGGLAACMYAACTVDTLLEGKRVALSVSTDYPFRGAISIKIRENEKGEFPIYLRIPKWSTGTKLSINGEQAYSCSEKNGWICIVRNWQKEDSVQIEFSMELAWSRWPGNGSVSVDYGPLSYSLRIKEEYGIPEDAGAYNHPEPHLWDNYEILPGSSWNYGMPANDGNILDQIYVSYRAKDIAPQPWEQSAAPIVLKAKARKIPQWQLQDGAAAELQQSPIYTAEPEEEVELIPMGCARLRISCFPVVSRDPDANIWKPVPKHVPLEERVKQFPNPYLIRTEVQDVDE